MENLLDKLKVGDTVWTAQHGEGKVISTNNGDVYPIEVEISNDHVYTYTRDGIFDAGDDNLPTLFLTNPWENQFQERVMEVSSDKHNWHKRVVFAEKDEKYIAWYGAETLEEAEEVVCTDAWDYAREVKTTPEPQKPTDEEVKTALKVIERALGLN